MMLRHDLGSFLASSEFVHESASSVKATNLKAVSDPKQRAPICRGIERTYPFMGNVK